MNDEYAEIFTPYLSDTDFTSYVWQGWIVMVDYATGLCSLYDPYGTFVADSISFEAMARQAVQIEEAW